MVVCYCGFDEVLGAIKVSALRFLDSEDMMLLADSGTSFIGYRKGRDSLT